MLEYEVERRIGKSENTQLIYIWKGIELLPEDENL